jgi:hypothetical protein
MKNQTTSGVSNRMMSIWNNFKWLIKEVALIYSSGRSFFSKKRVESGAAFIIAQWGMIFFLIKKYQTLSMTDFLLWASVEFAVSGYLIHKIEQSKKLDSTLTTAGEEEKDK